MNKKFIFYLIFICILNLSCFGQVNIYSNTGSVNSPFGATVVSTTRIAEIKYKPKLTGSSYISDNWALASIVFTKDTSIISDLMIKMDAFNNIIEIQYNNEIKILPASMVMNIIIQGSDDVFITKDALGKGQPDGFFKVIYNEKSSLLCHYTTKIKKSNYNEAMAVGNKDDEIVVTTKYYAYIDKQLVELETTRKKLVKQFQDKPEIVNYIMENKINPKNENMLVQLIEFIDTKENGA